MKQIITKNSDLIELLVANGVDIIIDEHKRNLIFNDQVHLVSDVLATNIFGPCYDYTIENI